MSFNKWASGPAVALLFSGLLAYGSGPQTFTYQGQLLDTNGDPATDTVDLIFQIYSPDGACLLYEEQQLAQNFTTTSGHFSVQVGSPLTSAKRTANDPALSMTQIFSNHAGSLRSSGAANCVSGYSPASGHSRRLRVTIVGPGGADVLTPDQTISAAPFAVTAETLQGKLPGDFLFNSLSGMQAAIEALVSGTSTMYMKMDGSNLLSPVSFNNQRLTGIALPSTATDAVNKGYADQRVAGIQVAMTAPTAGQTLIFNSVTGQWQPGSPQDTSVQSHARAPASACSGNQASQWNGNAWVCVSAGGTSGAGGSTIHQQTSGTITLSANAAKANFTNLTIGGLIQLPDATTMPLGGPLFNLFNSSGESIPVINSAGQFLGALPGGNGQFEVFLANNSTAGGDWRFGGGVVYSVGTERKVFSNFGFSSSANFEQIIQMSPTSYILIYSYTGNRFAVGFTLDPSALSVTWGTPVQINNYVDQNSNPVVDTNGVAVAEAFSATKAVIIFYNSGVSRILSLSGNTVTVGAANFSASCNFYNQRVVKLTSTSLLCAGAQSGILNGKLLSFDGATGLTESQFTSADVSNNSYIQGIIPLSATLAVIMVVDQSASPAQLRAQLMNVGGLTFGSSTTLGSGWDIMANSSSMALNYFVIDGSSLLVAFGLQMSTSRKLAKLTTDGTSVTVASLQSTPVMTNDQGVLFNDAGTLYLFYGEERYPITGIANSTPTIGAREKSGSGGYRLSKSRFFNIQGVNLSNGTSEFQVQFGRTY